MLLADTVDKKICQATFVLDKKILINFDYHVQFIWFTIRGKEIRSSSVIYQDTGPRIRFLKKSRPGPIFQKEDRIRTMFFSVGPGSTFFLTTRSESNFSRRSDPNPGQLNPDQQPLQVTYILRRIIQLFSDAFCYSENPLNFKRY